MAPLHAEDCPQPPPIKSDLRTLIMHEACETAGGVSRLAALLSVPVKLLTSWLEGAAMPPDEIYRACADIVLLA